ncbi:MAG: hypothetical protein Q9218_003325 [Villophora microphyllina]
MPSLMLRLAGFGVSAGKTPGLRLPASHFLSAQPHRTLFAQPNEYKLGLILYLSPTSDICNVIDQGQTHCITE